MFQPDFRKRQRPPITYTYISFQNVPTEADEDAMTEFVEDHAIVVGHPRYPPKNLDGIEYLAGTRFCRVHSIRHHIPRLIKLFGRQIKCIYDGQPEQTQLFRNTNRSIRIQNRNRIPIPNRNPTRNKPKPATGQGHKSKSTSKERK